MNYQTSTEVEGAFPSLNENITRDVIGYEVGALGNAGCAAVAAWRDARGFHRFYASGFETPERAREVAAQGAKSLGFIAPRRWQFWKEGLALEMGMQGTGAT